MRISKHVGWVCSAGLLVACGGSSTTNGFSGGDASADGSRSQGGASGSGGSSASGGLGGALSTGGVGGTSGAAGADTGGAVGTSDSGACAGPMTAGGASICVTVVPEKITARLDKALDKKGTYVVQVFDVPSPGPNAKPLAERSLPLNPLAELSVDALPMVRFENLFPATVYIRAIFADNPDGIKPGGALSYGTWLGGFNLKDGLQEKEPILPVPITRGIANEVSLDLVALRKLTVTVTLEKGVTPVGDGQGPLTVVAANGDDPSKKPEGFGVAKVACADITKGDVAATGFVIGAGPYWVTGILNDSGLPGDLPAGSLASLAMKNGKLLIPEELDIVARDYAPTIAIPLEYKVPWPLDAGPIPPNSCADLAARGDGGVDAGP